jgi:hypothetical protein
MTTSKPVTLQVGDKVAFARAFLRNTGQYTGWAPFARGVVTKVEPFATFRGDHDSRALVSVQWAKACRSRVLDCNLVRVDRMHLEPV